VRLDTARRAEVAERVSAGLAFLHRHGIAASDIAPNNLLVAFEGATAVCFIDCDSMALRGRSALPSVQTGDWEVPASFAESPDTRAADAYKLGLVILRLFARSHDTRAPEAHLRHVPVELRDLMYRSLGAAAMNRPTAAEWQRAVSGLLADRTLNQRYPGPAAARPAALRPAALRPAALRPAALRPARPAPARPAALRPARARPALMPRASPVAGLWLRRTVVALWLVAGTAVLLVVLSRLFAAAVPGWDSGGGSPAGAGATSSYQYYYYPGPRRAPGGFVQVP
jgi:hypothetical protein